LNNGVHGFSV